VEAVYFGIMHSGITTSNNWWWFLDSASSRIWLR